MPIILNPDQQSQRGVVDHAVAYISQVPFARDILNSDRNFSLELNSHGVTQVINRDGSMVIMWDPTSATVFRMPDGSYQVSSPAAMLFHEIAHVYFGLQGYTPQDQAKMEEWVTKIEGWFNSYLKEPVRLNYADAIDSIKVDNTTQHTEGNKWVAMKKDGKYVADKYTGNLTDVIPVLDDMPTIEAPWKGKAGGGAGGGGGGGIPIDGDMWVPGDIPIVDPSIPKNPNVDVIPGIVTPDGGTGGLMVPEPPVLPTVEPPVKVAHEEVPILIGVLQEPSPVI